MELDIDKTLCTMEDLPIETLEYLLEFAKTSDLLKNCRLVSTLWDELASKICRQRQVKLLRKDIPIRKRDLVSSTPTLLVFKNPGNLPWSKVELGSSPAEYQFNLRMLSTYGAGIESLAVYVRGKDAGETTFKDFWQVLSFVPNLKRLEITGNYKSGSIATLVSFPAEHPKISLKKLKHCRISITLYPYPLDFLELLLYQLGVTWESFDVTFDSSSGKDGPNDFSCAVQLLLHCTTIKKLSFKAPYFGFKEGWELLSTQTLNFSVKKLAVTLDSLGTTRLPTDHDFGPLQRFLVKCPELHQLYLQGELNTKSRSRPWPIELPAILTLKTLLTNFEHWDSGPRPGNAVQFTPITPVQFPALTRVDLNEEHWHGITPGGLSLFADSSSRFLSVTRLYVYSHKILPKDWLQCFPNVVNLNYAIVEAEEMVEIAGCFPKLTKLGLEFVSSTICGNSQRIIDTTRNLSNVRGIKRLAMTLPREVDIGDGEDAFVAVFKNLYPMKLKIYLCKLSECAVSELKHHHLLVLVKA